MPLAVFSINIDRNTILFADFTVFINESGTIPVDSYLFFFWQFVHVEIDVTDNWNQLESFESNEFMAHNNTSAAVAAATASELPCRSEAATDDQGSIIFRCTPSSATRPSSLLAYHCQWAAQVTDPHCCPPTHAPLQVLPPFSNVAIATALHVGREESYTEAGTCCSSCV